MEERLFNPATLWHRVEAEANQRVSELTVISILLIEGSTRLGRSDSVNLPGTGILGLSDR